MNELGQINRCLNTVKTCRIYSTYINLKRASTIIVYFELTPKVFTYSIFATAKHSGRTFPFNPFTAKCGQRQISTKFANFIFSNFEKQMASCESTGRELSFEWSHHRISSIDSKVRVTLQNSIKHSSSERVKPYQEPSLGHTSLLKHSPPPPTLVKGRRKLGIFHVTSSQTTYLFFHVCTYSLLLQYRVSLV